MGKFDRNNRPGGRGGFGNKRPDRAQMYKATCGNCGKSCEVPFRPTGDRPVLCSDCFSKSRNDRGGRDSGRGRSFDRDRKTMYSAVCSNCGDKCEVPFKPTGDKPIYCNKCFDQAGGSGRHKGEGKPSQPQTDQFAALNAKLDQILAVLSAQPAAKPKVVKKPAAKKVAKKVVKKTVKKKTATKKK